MCFFLRKVALASFLTATTAAYASTLAVPGKANPWLAGATNGASATGGDSAPAESPASVVNVTIVPRHILTFGAAGSVGYSGATADPPDGQPGYPVTHGAENGVSSVTAPVDALLGVFLDDLAPGSSSAPEGLNFSTVEAQNYGTLSPGLKQVFLIGDGTNSVGTIQRVIVPDGATRLYLGTMDGSGWYDNSGSFGVQVSDLGSVGPIITSIRILDRSNVVLTAAGGTPNGQVVLRSSTNGLTLPASESVTNVLTFRATGLVNYSGSPSDPPDGQPSYAVAHNPENGIAGVTAPVDSLLGVFLDDSIPDGSNIPESLSFATLESQNYVTLSPALRQVFLIGDGTNSANEIQRVITPFGARRLFLGTMDGSGWYNNTGSFSVSVSGANAGLAITVAGSSNPWLAGATNGTPAASGDLAPAQSPVLVANLAFPSASWSSLSTNHFDLGGFYTWTNSVPSGERQRFFHLITYQ